MQNMVAYLQKNLSFLCFPLLPATLDGRLNRGCQLSLTLFPQQIIQ